MSNITTAASTNSTQHHWDHNGHGHMHFSQFYKLVRGGLLASEYSPWPNLPMNEAVHNIIKAANNTNISESSEFATYFHKKCLNVTELQKLENLIPTLPHDNIATRTTVAFVIITVATVVTVALRFYSRWRHTRRVKAEDWSAVVALLFCLMTAGFFITLNTHGFAGIHIWQLSYQQVRVFVYLQMCCGLIFKATHLPVKVTFLICYYGLLPQRSRLRGCVVAIFAFVVATTIFGIFAVIFKCHPVDAPWNDMARAKCVNKILVFNIWGSFTILADAMILVLPMPVVWKLKLSVKEKLLVSAVFALGGFVVIASVNRLLTLDDFYRSPDMTYTICKNMIWTLLEVDLGLMISCVPALRAFVNTSAQSQSSSRRRRRRQQQGGTSLDDVAELPMSRRQSDYSGVNGKSNANANAIATHGSQESALNLYRLDSTGAETSEDIITEERRRSDEEHATLPTSPTRVVAVEKICAEQVTLDLNGWRERQASITSEHNPGPGGPVSPSIRFDSREAEIENKMRRLLVESRSHSSQSDDRRAE